MGHSYLTVRGEILGFVKAFAKDVFIEPQVDPLPRRSRPAKPGARFGPYVYIYTHIHIYIYIYIYIYGPGTRLAPVVDALAGSSKSLVGGAFRSTRGWFGARLPTRWPHCRKTNITNTQHQNNKQHALNTSKLNTGKTTPTVASLLPDRGAHRRARIRVAPLKGPSCLDFACLFRRENGQVRLTIKGHILTLNGQFITTKGNRLTMIVHVMMKRNIFIVKGTDIIIS